MDGQSKNEEDRETRKQRRKKTDSRVFFRGLTRDMTNVASDGMDGCGVRDGAQSVQNISKWKRSNDG